MSTLFSVAVGDPPNHVTVRAVRRRAARRRVITGAAAAVAAIAAVGIGMALAGSVVKPIPAAPSPAPAGLPRFYVESGFTAAPQAQNVVRATATGAITGTVKCPLPHSRVTDEAFAGKATVFMSCEQLNGQYVPTGARIYRFRITNSGRPVGYALVPGAVFTGARIDTIGADANGSEVAAVVIGVKPGSASEVVVINTASGARAIWRNSVVRKGVRFNPGTLSFADHGRELASLGYGRCVEHAGLSPCQSPGAEMLVVSPAWAGGQFANGRRIFGQASIITQRLLGFIEQGYISPDGRTAIVGIAYNGPGQNYVSAVLVSASTGKPVRNVFKMSFGTPGFSFSNLSVDPTGRYVLFDAGPPGGPVNGWIYHGKLVPLQPAGQVSGEVW